MNGGYTMDQMGNWVKAGLKVDTAFLVSDFADALAAKLLKVQEEKKRVDDWKYALPERLRAALYEHIEKGDPVDVAAFAAFLWWHGESTKEWEASDE